MSKQTAKLAGKKKLIADLEELAGRLNIKVRHEVTKARGGLCSVNGEMYIIVDRKASDDYKINVIATSLKKCDLNDVYISPKIRDLLDNL